MIYKYISMYKTFLGHQITHDLFARKRPLQNQYHLFLLSMKSL